jgi:hypothetical protein
MYAVVNDTGFFINSQFGAWNILLCNVNVASATYRYTNSSFIIKTTAPADLNMMRCIATMMTSENSFAEDLVNCISNAVEGIGMVTGDYVSSFALELSRELAAMSASIYEPGAVSELIQLVLGIGAKLELVPLDMLLTVLLVYNYLFISLPDINGPLMVGELA